MKRKAVLEELCAIVYYVQRETKPGVARLTGYVMCKRTLDDC